jgi:hypothetical protein
MRQAPASDDGLLQRLVGSQLTSVLFVMDYVQLGFQGEGDDSPVLSCDVWPAIEGSDGVLTHGRPGYADALVALVMGAVVGTVERPRTGLRVELDRGTLVLNPAIDELVGPEIALLSGFADRQWMCWRPGEDAFEHLA